MMYIHSCFRVHHHQEQYPWIQNCLMTYISRFESCLMYQNQELLLDFVYCMFQGEEKAEDFLGKMESNALFVCEMFFVR